MPVTLIEFTPASIAGGSATGTISATKVCSAASAVIALHWNGEWASPPTPACTVAGAAAALVESISQGAGQAFERAWLKENVAAGSTAVVVNGFQAGRSCTLLAYELLGVPASAVEDVSTSHTAASSALTYFGAPAGGVDIAAGSMAIAAIYVNGESGPVTPPPGWTALTSPTPQDGRYTYVAAKLFATAATGERAAFGGTINGAAYDGILVAVKTGAVAPILTTPANDTPGPTSVNVKWNTDTLSDGTNYVLHRIGGSAALAAAIISSGTSAAAGASNPQSQVMSGYTPGSGNHYFDAVQNGAGGPSNVLTIGPITMASQLEFANTLDPFASALSFAQFVPSGLTINANIDPFTSSLVLGQAQGIINFPPLANGSIGVWVRGDITAFVKDRATDAPICTIPNVVATLSGGQLSHPSIISGASYRVTFVVPPGPGLPSGAEGTWRFQGA